MHESSDNGLAQVLRTLGGSVWDLMNSALTEHIRQHHLPPPARRRGPVNLLPVSGAELVEAQDVVRSGGRLADVAAALGVAPRDFREVLERHVIDDYLRLHVLALSEQPSSTAAD